MWKNVLGRTDKPDEASSKRKDDAKSKDDSRPKRKDSMKESDKDRRDSEAMASPSTRKAPRGDDRGIEDEKKSRRRDRSTSRERKGSRRDRSRSEERGKDDKEKKLKRRSTDNGFYSGEISRSQTSRALDDTTKVEKPISNHVPDMFPGQFPSGVTAPYRPPLSVSEGGPGLASEYYHDAGQSVVQQPGVRPDAPDVIMNTAPHLMMAGSSAAPPVEPSSLGQVGAAASFFTQDGAASTTSASRPAPQSSTSSIIPAIGAAAASYAMNSSTAHTSSSQTESYHTRPTGSSYPMEANASSRPQQSGKQSSFNVPYAAAAGAAGLAAGAYYNHHHLNDRPGGQSGDGYTSNEYNTGMVTPDRRSGPLDKIIDFFKDPEGVARFEEYSEITGICRGCFEPGTSARQAPRRHNVRSQRSIDKLRTSRVDKDNRYYVSSDIETRKKSNKSLLGTAAAGLGLAAVGRSLTGNFDDTYSVKSGRYRSSDSAPRRSSQDYRQEAYSARDEKRYKKSEKKVEYGIAEDGAVYRKSKPNNGKADNVITVERRHSSSDSSDSRKLRNSAVGTAVGGAVAAAAATRISSGDVIKVRRKSRSRSSERKTRRRQSPVQSPSIFGRFFSSPPSDGRRKKSRGFFNFSNGSSSSDSSIVFESSERDSRRRNKRSSPRIQTAAEANAALIGLGTAAAALAAHESRNKKPSRQLPPVAAVRMSRMKHDRPHEAAEDGWESASETDDSADSDLAFGSPLNRSRESLVENGTDKWNWRWGQKKSRSSIPRTDAPQSESGVLSQTAAGITGIAAGAAAGALVNGRAGQQDARPLRDIIPPSTRPIRHTELNSMSDPRPYINRHGEPIVEQEPHQAHRGTVPMQQPQPIVPVPDSVYRGTDADGITIQPKSTRNREDGVRFDFTKEQEDRYRARDHEDQPSSGKSRDYDLDRGRRGRDTISKSTLSKYEDGDFELIEPGRKQPSFVDREIQPDELDAGQFAEVQAELARLRAYRSLKKEQQGEGKNKASFALAGMAAIAVAAEAKKKRAEDRAEREKSEKSSPTLERKPATGFAALVSALANKKKQEAATEKGDAKTETQKDQDVIAREIVNRATAKVKIARAASPVHESYASYFAPDILSKQPGVKETNPDPNADVSFSASHDALGTGLRGRMSEPEFPKIENEQFDPVEWHKDLPWRVPRLGLINPTPPVSRASSRNPSAQPSPMIKPSEPSIAEEDEQHADRDERSNADADADADYTVIAPKEPHERTTGSKGPITLRRIDDPVTPSSSKENSSTPENTKQTKMPGAFEDDIDFAATLAAGAEAAGFDPNIVVDDPAFRRRDSPPGSQSLAFYQQPYYQTVSDIGLQSGDKSAVGPQRGFVEGEEVPNFPKEDNAKDSKISKKDGKTSRKEQRKKDKVSKRFGAVEGTDEAAEMNTFYKEGEESRLRNNAELEIIEDMARDTQTEPDTPVLNDKKSSKREPLSDFAATAFAASSGVAAAKVADEATGNTPKPNTKAPTKTRGFDLAALVLAAAKKEAAESQANNAEPKPDSGGPDKTNSRGLVNAATTIIPSSDKMQKDPSIKAESTKYNDDEVNDVYDSPNEYAPSAYAASTSGYVEDESRKHKRKSKRRSKTFDDSPTVTSSAKAEDDKDTGKDLTKSKDRKGGLFGLFSKSSSNEGNEKQTSKEAPTEASEQIDEPKRKKKSRRSKDSSDFYSIASTSAGDLTKLDDDDGGEDDRRSRRRRSRKDSMDDQVNGREVSGPDELDRANETDNQASKQSFLGERREKPKPPDIDTFYNDSGGVDSGSSQRSNSSPPHHRPSTPPKIDWIRDDAFTPEAREARPRRLSLVQGSSHASPATPSPTAIPLVFRKPPSSAAARSSSVTSSPSLTTPKSRKTRPSSVEFRSNEFRPLWLVTQYQPKQELDPEEVLPSLPSSHSNSRSSSIHEDEFRARDALENQSALKEINTTTSAVEILDSGQTTPTVASYRAKRERDLLDEARQEAVAREIEWNLRNSPESKRRSQEIQNKAPSLAQDGLQTAGLAIIAGGIAAVALKNPGEDKKPDHVFEETTQDKVSNTGHIDSAESPGHRVMDETLAIFADGPPNHFKSGTYDEPGLGLPDEIATPIAKNFTSEQSIGASTDGGLLAERLVDEYDEAQPVRLSEERSMQHEVKVEEFDESNLPLARHMDTFSIFPPAKKTNEVVDVDLAASATLSSGAESASGRSLPEEKRPSIVEEEDSPRENLDSRDRIQAPADEVFVLRSPSKKDRKKVKKSQTFSESFQQPNDSAARPGTSSNVFEDDVKWATPVTKKSKKGNQTVSTESKDLDLKEATQSDLLATNLDDSLAPLETSLHVESGGQVERENLIEPNQASEADEWSFGKKSKKKSKKSKPESLIAAATTAVAAAASNVSAAGLNETAAKDVGVLPAPNNEGAKSEQPDSSNVRVDDWNSTWTNKKSKKDKKAKRNLVMKDALRIDTNTASHLTDIVDAEDDTAGLKSKKSKNRKSVTFLDDPVSMEHYAKPDHRDSIADASSDEQAPQDDLPAVIEDSERGSRHQEMAYPARSRMDEIVDESPFHISSPVERTYNLPDADPNRPVLQTSAVLSDSTILDKDDSFGDILSPRPIPIMDNELDGQAIITPKLTSPDVLDNSERLGSRLRDSNLIPEEPFTTREGEPRTLRNVHEVSDGQSMPVAATPQDFIQHAKRQELSEFTEAWHTSNPAESGSEFITDNDFEMASEDQHVIKNETAVEKFSDQQDLHASLGSPENDENTTLDDLSKESKESIDTDWGVTSLKGSKEKKKMVDSLWADKLKTEGIENDLAPPDALAGDFGRAPEIADRVAPEMTREASSERMFDSNTKKGKKGKKNRKQSLNWLDEDNAPKKASTEVSETQSIERSFDMTEDNEKLHDAKANLSKSLLGASLATTSLALIETEEEKKETTGALESEEAIKASIDDESKTSTEAAAEYERPDKFVSKNKTKDKKAKTKASSFSYLQDESQQPENSASTAVRDEAHPQKTSFQSDARDEAGRDIQDLAPTAFTVVEEPQIAEVDKGSLVEKKSKKKDKKKRQQAFTWTNELNEADGAITTAPAKGADLQTSTPGPVQDTAAGHPHHESTPVADASLSSATQDAAVREDTARVIVHNGEEISQGLIDDFGSSTADHANVLPKIDAAEREITSPDFLRSSQTDRSRVGTDFDSQRHDDPEISGVTESLGTSGAVKKSKKKDEKKPQAFDWYEDAERDIPMPEQLADIADHPTGNEDEVHDKLSQNSAHAGGITAIAAEAVSQDAIELVKSTSNEDNWALPSKKSKKKDKKKHQSFIWGEGHQVDPSTVSSALDEVKPGSTVAPDEHDKKAEKDEISDVTSTADTITTAMLGTAAFSDPADRSRQVEEDEWLVPSTKTKKKDKKKRQAVEAQDSPASRLDEDIPGNQLPLTDVQPGTASLHDGVRNDFTFIEDQRAFPPVEVDEQSAITSDGRTMRDNETSAQVVQEDEEFDSWAPKKKKKKSKKQTLLDDFGPVSTKDSAMDITKPESFTTDIHNTDPATLSYEEPRFVTDKESFAASPEGEIDWHGSDDIEPILDPAHLPTEELRSRSQLPDHADKRDRAKEHTDVGIAAVPLAGIAVTVLHGSQNDFPPEEQADGFESSRATSSQKQSKKGEKSQTFISDVDILQNGVNTSEENMMQDDDSRGRESTEAQTNLTAIEPKPPIEDHIWELPDKKKGKKAKAGSLNISHVRAEAVDFKQNIDDKHQKLGFHHSEAGSKPVAKEVELAVIDNGWGVPIKKKGKKSKHKPVLDVGDDSLTREVIVKGAGDPTLENKSEGFHASNELDREDEDSRWQISTPDTAPNPHTTEREAGPTHFLQSISTDEPTNRIDFPVARQPPSSSLYDKDGLVEHRQVMDIENEHDKRHAHLREFSENEKDSRVTDAVRTASKVGTGIAIFEGILRATSMSEEHPVMQGRTTEKETNHHVKISNGSTDHVQSKDLSDIHPAHRDSALQMNSPDVTSNRDSIRDSGFQDEPLRSFDVSVEVDPSYEVMISSPTVVHPTIDHIQDEPELPATRETPLLRQHGREPSPVDATSRERSAALFSSSPSTRNEIDHGRRQSHEDVYTETMVPDKSIFGGTIGYSSDRDIDQLRSPPRTPTTHAASSQPLMTITETSPEDEKNTRELYTSTPDTKRRSGFRRVKSPNIDSPRRLGLISTDDFISRLSWPEVEDDQQSVELERSTSRNSDKEQRPHSSIKRKPLSVNLDGIRSYDRRSLSLESNESISAIIRSPPPTSTPPLRRTDRSISSELRSARTKSQAFSPTTEKYAKPDLIDENNTRDLEEGIASSSTYDPIKDKGKGRLSKMADVYEGYGDMAGSPHSPTRPSSVRRRQSLQVLDLEARVDQLLSENRLLLDSKNRAERSLELTHQDSDQHNQALQDAIQTRDQFLQQKDEELSSLREKLQVLQDQVAHLGEANRSINGDDEGRSLRYQDLEADHAATREQLVTQTEKLEELKNKHASLSGGMEAIVANEVRLALQSKDEELDQVRSELESAKQQVKALQQQILAARRGDDHLVDLDEDYFEERCEELCKHVQSFVLRYSKFSDMRICRRMDEVQDEGITDRFDNAILDGTDVDIYLGDRIRRRDVFMSVVMSIMWNYIFTRYLFGMDREQRSKLKSLEKTLTEVGSRAAVNKWRATTLTMLSKREAFATQREQDIEAVVSEILRTLAAFLPPPPNLRDSIVDSLRKVVSSAVDLSIEMRTQRSEYIMLAPLQPEFNLQGDLETMVYFNAASMSERSGQYTDNKALEEEQAIVRIVLFPLVIKQEEGDEQEVIYQAQALITRDDDDADTTGRDRRAAQVMSAQGTNRSAQSFAPSTIEGGMF